MSALSEKENLADVSELQNVSTEQSEEEESVRKDDILETFSDRDWSALRKCMALGSLEAAYSSYFLYERKMALLSYIKSRLGKFSSWSHRESFRDV